MSKPNINLNYKEQEGMLLPDLQISNSSEADQPLGRYGRMALEYLRENHPERFTTLKMDGSLMEIMHRVQDEATEKIEALTQQMLQQEPLPQTEDIMEPSVVYGYFPCYSEGNDLVVLWHEDGPDGQPEGSERTRFTFPRQRRDRRLCLADFFRSKEAYEAEGRPDVISFQLVTMGEKVSGVTGQLYAQNAYRDYLELHGLSVQLTEALAEFWHARVRSELGFADSAELGLDQVLDVRFRGCRYSFGYPACPELEQRALLVELLEPERIGVELSEELQLHPEQSTDALVVHHPEAKYFKV